MELQEILDIMEQLLNKVDSICLYEMAEKQGYDKQFTYYTLDNEYKTHYPHVHICVKNDSKWDGKPLRSGRPYKTVGSIKLNRIDSFTPQNIEFEEIKDTRITGTKYKKIFCEWLNSTNDGTLNNIDTNACRCLKSYIRNNEQGYYHTEVLKILGVS